MYLGFIVAFVEVLFTVLFWAVIARVLLSWFPIKQDNPIVILLKEVTDPLLGTVTRILGPYSHLGVIDITPIVTIVLLQLLRSLVVAALISAA